MSQSRKETVGIIRKAFEMNEAEARGISDGDSSRGSTFLRTLKLIGTTNETEALAELGKRSSSKPRDEEEKQWNWDMGGRSSETNLETEAQKKKNGGGEVELFHRKPDLMEAGGALLEQYLVGLIGKKDDKPLIHRLEDAGLDIFSDAVRWAQTRTGVDLHIDDFDVATSANIKRKVDEAVKAHHGIIPPGVGVVSMHEVEDWVHTHAAQMLAAAFGKTWKDRTPTPEEEALAYHLLLTGRRKWMDMIKDHTFALATDSGAEQLLGGRLAQYHPIIQQNVKRMKKGERYPRDYFVQDPYSLRPLSKEERELIAWTLFGLTNNNLTLLPISTNQLVPDVKGFGYALMFPGDAHPDNPDAVIMRPGTPTFIDVLREKIPVLSPALAGRSPRLVSGTIVLESASTGDIKGVFGTLEPNKVIDYLTDAGDVARGVAEMVKMSQDAVLAPNSHPWTKRVPRAAIVLDRALELSQKSPREKARIRADFEAEGRFLKGDSDAFDYEMNPTQATEDREEERLGQLHRRKEAIQQRLVEMHDEAVKKGYIERDQQRGGWRKTFIGAQHPEFFDSAEKMAGLHNYTKEETMLIETVQRGRKRGVLTGAGGFVHKIFRPTDDDAVQAMRLRQKLDRQFTIRAEDRPVRGGRSNGSSSTAGD